MGADAGGYFGNCGSLSTSGDECDLYVNGEPHGGQMHSGLRDGVRIWWSKATGRVVNFAPVLDQSEASS